MHIFNDRKVSVSTIKNYRSSISFYWISLVGYEIPEHLQSPLFRNGENISDKDLTLKTTFLLALASGIRRSELHAFNKKVEWLQQGTCRAVRLSPDPPFVSKTHLSSGGIGALKPFVISQVPDTDTASEENSQLCVVRTLQCYLQRTEKYCTKN